MHPQYAVFRQLARRRHLSRASARVFRMMRSRETMVSRDGSPKSGLSNNTPSKTSLPSSSCFPLRALKPGLLSLVFLALSIQNCVYQDKVALIPFQFFSFKTTIFYLLVLTACSELWDVRWTAIQQQENNLKPTTLQVCQSGLEHLSFGFNARLGFSLSFQKHTSTDLWGSFTGFNKPFLDPVICTFQYPGFVI